MTTIDPNTTLTEATNYLRENFDKGAKCPCCGQFVKRYKRKLNASMAYVLILIDRWDRCPMVGDYVQGGEYLHVPSYLAWSARRNPVMAAAIRGDWAKLKHWNLLAEWDTKRDDGSKRAGYYKMTSLGRAFVKGEIHAAAHIYMYNEDAQVDPDAPLISIRDALGVKFSYDELMKETT